MVKNARLRFRASELDKNARTMARPRGKAKVKLQETHIVADAVAVRTPSKEEEGTSSKSLPTVPLAQEQSGLSVCPVFPCVS